MTLVLEFVLPPNAGEAVDDCVRITLEPYFSRFELTLEPRHTMLIDDEGRFRMVPTTAFRFVAYEERASLTDRIRIELEQTIHDCFMRANAPGDHSVRWEE